jgi:hypothetical protein
VGLHEQIGALARLERADGKHVAGLELGVGFVAPLARRLPRRSTVAHRQMPAWPGGHGHDLLCVQAPLGDQLPPHLLGHRDDAIRPLRQAAGTGDAVPYPLVTTEVAGPVLEREVVHREHEGDVGRHREGSDRGCPQHVAPAHHPVHPRASRQGRGGEERATVDECRADDDVRTRDEPRHSRVGLPRDEDSEGIVRPGACQGG